MPASNDNPLAVLPPSSRQSAGPAHGVSLTEASRVWARVAMLSFGGPAGQIAVMHRIIVDERKWVPESRVLHALNYCMLLPGPEGQQLATYIGWLMHRTVGGLIAGGLFILPGVIAIMTRESLLGNETPAHALPSAKRALHVSLIWLGVWLIPVAAILLVAGPGNVFSQIALFFSKMAVVTFGGGFMAAFRSPGEMAPLIAGALGGLLATWVTFAPCFLWIFLGGPYIGPRQQGALWRAGRHHRRRRRSHPEPRHLVRHSCHLSRDRPRQRIWAVFRQAGSQQHRFLELRSLYCRSACDLQVSARDASDLGGFLRRRDDPVSRRRNLEHGKGKS